MAILFVSVLACSRAPADLESHQLAVINGVDDRRQAFSAPAHVRDALVAASAALIYAHHLVERVPGAVTLRALPAKDALGLCEDEPFGAEPAAAFCSAVLIDHDLVATARHCLGATPARRCRDLRIVFGYALSESDRPVVL
ncbi:MAG TPA: hypothetical protein VGF45_05040, partial [Polyangia bacterium]